MPEAQGAPNPPQPTSYKPQQFNWKNALLMFLIGATVIFAGVSTYYYLQLNSTAPTPQLKPPKVSSPSATPKPEQPTVIPDETADWKTYTHTEDNYKISYPPEWTVSINQIGSLNISSPDYTENSTTKIPITGTKIGVNKAENSQGLSLEQSAEVTGIEFSRKKIKVDNRDAITTDSTYEAVYSTNVTILEGKYSYHILGSYPKGQKSQYEKIFDLMLSTFKFLD